MSKDTRKAILNAKHTIEIKSLDELDAIQARYSESVKVAKATRKGEIANVKVSERNELRDIILKINTGAEAVRDAEHKAVVERLKGSTNPTAQAGSESVTDTDILNGRKDKNSKKNTEA